MPENARKKVSAESSSVKLPTGLRDELKKRAHECWLATGTQPSYGALLAEMWEELRRSQGQISLGASDAAEVNNRQSLPDHDLGVLLDKLSGVLGRMSGDIAEAGQYVVELREYGDHGREQLVDASRRQRQRIRQAREKAERTLRGDGEVKEGD